MHDFHPRGGESAILIVDPSKTTLTYVRPANRFFWVVRETGSPSSGWGYHGGRPIFTDDHAEIHEVPCTRVLLKPPTDEQVVPGFLWVSLDHAVVMFDDNPAADLIWEITSIRLEEPNPEVFEVPAEFTEIEAEL